MNISVDFHRWFAQKFGDISTPTAKGISEEQEPVNKFHWPLTKKF